MFNLKAIGYIASILLLFSCGRKENKVLDMSDITPKSERDYTQHKEQNKDTIDFDFNSAVANELGFNLSGLKFNEALLFPDRFLPKRTNKLVLMQEVDSTLFCQWSFKDSTQTKNAFYNWLDCFGEKCKSIKFGETINFQKDNFVILVNDSSITYITSSKKMQQDDWLNYFEKAHEIKNWKTVINQGSRAKATWFKVVDGKKEPLKQLK
jgi:hypothetical protein